MFSLSSLRFITIVGLWTVLLGGVLHAAENNEGSSEETAELQAQDDISSEVLEAQVLMDRIHFSPGAIDGRMGTNSENALRAYQRALGLEATGELDEETSKALQKTKSNLETSARLQITKPPFESITTYKVAEADWAHDFVTSIPDEMAKQASMAALNYTTVPELLAERFHCTPELLLFLNPDSDLSTGSVIIVPNVIPTWIRADVEQLENYVQRTYASRDETSAGRKKNNNNSNESSSDEGEDEEKDEGEDSADLKGQKTDDGRITSSGLQIKPEGKLTIIVAKEETSLNVVDEQGKVVFHAPVTAGSEHDPLPLGEWTVNGTERFPKFNYNPELFWDAEDDDKKAKLPAGPNNPVGVAWIDISKPHYGLHGTPDAETIGYSQSHGCVRLTNWDVLRLADMAEPETQVLFVKTEEEGLKAIEERKSDNTSDEEEKEQN